MRSLDSTSVEGSISRYNLINVNLCQNSPCLSDVPVSVILGTISETTASERSTSKRCVVVVLVLRCCFSFCFGRIQLHGCCRFKLISKSGLSFPDVHRKLWLWPPSLNLEHPSGRTHQPPYLGIAVGRRRWHGVFKYPSVMLSYFSTGYGEIPL